MIGKTMSVISQTDVEAYANDGVLLIKSLLTRNEVSDLREGIDVNISNPSSRAQVASDENDPGWFLEDFCTWQENPAYQMVIFESDISEVAAKLMCSKEVRLFHDHMLVKKREHFKERHGTRTNRTITLKECKISVFGFRLIPYRLNGHLSLSQVLTKILGICRVLSSKNRQSGFKRVSSKSFLMSKQIRINIEFLAGRWNRETLWSFTCLHYMQEQEQAHFAVFFRFV